VVANVEMVAFDPTDNNPFDVLTTTDANGLFDLGVYGGGGTATKTWQLNLNQGNTPGIYVSSDREFQVQDGVDINNINYLVYVVTAHLRGQVLDENNNPIGNINIFANNDFANTGSDTDSGGNFDIPIFGGTWKLGLSNINGLGLIPQDYSIVVTDGSDQNGLIFRAIHAGSTISGTVKSSTNVAIPGLTVSGTASTGGNSYSTAATTAADGSYSLPVFSSTWSVGVDSNGLISRGYQPVSSQNVFVSANVPGINFVAASLFKISSITHLANGHIMLQIAGAPNGGFHIQAAPDPNANSFGPLAPATADGSGFFTYEDTAPGTSRFYRLTVP
jgi:hypothetical protein